MKKDTKKKDTKWNTAVHEAGHVCIGRRLGRVHVGATVTVDRRGRARGRTTAGRRSRWRGTDFDYVVFLLAGAAAGRLVTGDPALCGSTDLDEARRVLAEIGRDFRDAERRAGAMVRRHRRDIENTARELYDTGWV